MTIYKIFILYIRLFNLNRCLVIDISDHISIVNFGVSYVGLMDYNLKAYYLFGVVGGQFPCA